MSTKFYAISRETGRRWTPNDSEFGSDKPPFLMMYDSGYLAVVTYRGYGGYHLEPLDPKKWEVVVKPNIMSKVKFKEETQWNN